MCVSAPSARMRSATFDPDFRSFFNVNTPEDWDAAEQMLAGELSGET